jgi:hypothetical protein
MFFCETYTTCFGDEKGHPSKCSKLAAATHKPDNNSLHRFHPDLAATRAFIATNLTIGR